jgi:cold-inducible RNA-binding protein
MATPPGMESPPERVPPGMESPERVSHAESDFHRAGRPTKTEGFLTAADLRASVDSPGFVVGVTSGGGRSALTSALARSPGDPRGDVDDATSTQAQDGEDEDEYDDEGREVRVGSAPAVPFSQRNAGGPKYHSGTHQQTNPNRIFVGGIPWKATEPDLAQFFSTFGEVVECKLIVDKETGSSKGYAFVTFDSVDAANKAKRAPEDALVLMGKHLNVGDAVRRISHDRPDNNNNNNQQQQRSPRHRGSPRGQRNANRYHQQQLDAWRAAAGQIHPMQAYMMQAQAMQAQQQQHSVSPGTSPGTLTSSGSPAMSPLPSSLPAMMYPTLQMPSPITPEAQQAAAMQQAQFLQMQARMYATAQLQSQRPGSAGGVAGFSPTSAGSQPDMVFAGVNEKGEPVFFAANSQSQSDQSEDGSTNASRSTSAGDLDASAGSLPEVASTGPEEG